MSRTPPTNCRRCELWKTRTNIVYPETITNTPDNIRIMIIGEAPGYHEDQQGRPFVGKSGKILREKIKLLPGKILISNVVKCRPPHNRDPQEQEKQACREFLEKEAETFDPHLVILVGRHATSSFLPLSKSRSMSSLSGMFFNGRFLPLIHPASLLYNPSFSTLWERSWDSILKTAQSLTQALAK